MTQSKIDENTSLKDIHDRMRRNLDIRLIEALETPGTSAAIMTAAIKRVEQIDKELAHDNEDPMAETIERLKENEQIVPDLDLEHDDEATSDRP